MIVSLLVLVVAAIMIAIELRRPGREWPRVSGWWARAAALNGFQALCAVALHPAIAVERPWTFGPVAGAFVGYLTITFVFYWWHRLRHESDLLWRWLHRVHHSAQRIEVITSFYKHPLEIVANSLLTSVILYGALGLSAEAGAGAVLLSGLAELFYHWNVSTPAWVGWFFQRPEMHCVHHEEGLHRYNYGDLPLWDMLFGTYRNPHTWSGRCGLGPESAFRFRAMLRAGGPAWALCALGLLQMSGDVLAMPLLKKAAAAAAASPAPKVFSTVGGLETFSTKFYVDGVEITPRLYKRLRGPYNRRNVYGAALAYGPVLPPELRDPVFHAALCDGRLTRELGLSGRPKAVDYVTRNGERIRLEVACP